MSVETQRRQGNYYLERPPVRRLTDVMEIVLDKGLVIDAYARMSLFGTELVTIDSRMVIASVDTYLRFAEATIRLDLHQHGGRVLTDLSETRDSAEERGEIQAAKRVRRNKDAKPQLDSHARDAVKKPRNDKRRAGAGMKSRDPKLAKRPPSPVHARPYDWKASTAADLLH